MREPAAGRVAGIAARFSWRPLVTPNPVANDRAEIRSSLPNMVVETWTTIALPILEEVNRGRGEDAQETTASLLQQANDDAIFCDTLADLLDDGFLAGATAHRAMGRPQPSTVSDIIRLTPKGRRAIGEWPSGDSGAVLVRALEDAMNRMPEGETNNRMQRLVEAAGRSARRS